MKFLGIKKQMASETKPKRKVSLKEVSIYAIGIVILIIILAGWWIGAGSYYFNQPTTTPQTHTPSIKLATHQQPPANHLRLLVFTPVKPVILRTLPLRTY
jgi:cytoskeletal protein RodZ